MQRLRSDWKIIRRYSVYGLIGGFCYALIEYFVSAGGANPQAFVPLIVRGCATGALILGSISAFESHNTVRFRNRPYYFLVLVRTLAWMLIFTFWLGVVNAIWYAVDQDQKVAEGLAEYFGGQTYVINLVTIFLGMIVAVGIVQIGKLHRKGELLKFVLGRYHNPKELELIFCFIDLKGSTTIAEELGNRKYAWFLKEYFADITDALKSTNAQICEYVGDEIILSWTFAEGLKENNFIRCFFEMKKTIGDLKDKYVSKYGVYPEFKAGVHGGEVMVTWVGELKKEVVFIGDVLNTTARIQENCNRLNSEFLISGPLLERVEDLGDVVATFAEETVLRGKGTTLGLYKLHLDDGAGVAE